MNAEQQTSIAYTQRQRSVCFISLQFYNWCLHFYVCLMCVYMSMGALMYGKHNRGQRTILLVSFLL